MSDTDGSILSSLFGDDVKPPPRLKAAHTLSSSDDSDGLYKSPAARKSGESNNNDTFASPLKKVKSVVVHPTPGTPISVLSSPEYRGPMRTTAVGGGSRKHPIEIISSPESVSPRNDSSFSKKSSLKNPPKNPCTSFMNPRKNEYGSAASSKKSVSKTTVVKKAELKVVNRKKKSSFRKAKARVDIPHFNPKKRTKHPRNQRLYTDFCRMLCDFQDLERSQGTMVNEWLLQRNRCLEGFASGILFEEEVHFDSADKMKVLRGVGAAYRNMFATYFQKGDFDDEIHKFA